MIWRGIFSSEVLEVGDAERSKRNTSTTFGSSLGLWQVVLEDNVHDTNSWPMERPRLFLFVQISCQMVLEPIKEQCHWQYCRCTREYPGGKVGCPHPIRILLHHRVKSLLPKNSWSRSDDAKWDWSTDRNKRPANRDLPFWCRLHLEYDTYKMSKVCLSLIASNN